MPNYRVELEAYAGPLDLLLYLVKRHEIDLNDIPIAKLTDQYLEHLEVIKQIDIEHAGEFLVMASTLLEIKSAMLMPMLDAGDEGDDPAAEVEDAGRLDPRYELVQQLLAYKRYKDAARALEHRFDDWQDRFPNVPAKIKDKDRPGYEPPSDDETTAEPIEVDLEDANVMELVEAFIRLMESVGTGPARHDVVMDDTPIALHAEDIVDRLGRDGSMSLQQMFIGRTNKGEMIGLFLAALELVRQRRVRVRQNPEQSNEIMVELRDPEEEEAQDDGKTAEERWRNPETGEVDYDFPSEGTRKRWERRKKLRATLAKKAAAAAEGEDADSDELADEDDGESLGAGDAIAAADAAEVEARDGSNRRNAGSGSDEDDDEDWDDDDEDWDEDDDDDEEDDDEDWDDDDDEDEEDDDDDDE